MDFVYETYTMNNVIASEIISRIKQRKNIE